MKFSVIYDGDWEESYETFKEAVEHIRRSYFDYLNDKELYPEEYTEDDAEFFQWWSIHEDVTPGYLDKLVKNKS